jgi:NTE family protein
VIGTSIGAVNAAVIAGNAREERLPRLQRMWQRFEHGNGGGQLATLLSGIPGFFAPRMPAWGGLQARVGLDAASYYLTSPLRETLSQFVEPERLGKEIRLTVGAVNVTAGTMRYFDSREEPITLDEIMASGALPPGFPAVRVNGEAYWDGGLYSNTPLEAVLDDNPRRSSLIFAVNVWQPTGHEPGSIWEVLAREKDIMYASRADSHIMRQKQIHRLRHVVRELYQHLSSEKQESPEVRQLASWGCHTVMHVVRLLAPALEGEDYWKDIDFSAAGMRFRREAGYADACRMLQLAPWQAPVDPMEGVIVHELSARSGG